MFHGREQLWRLREGYSNQGYALKRDNCRLHCLTQGLPKPTRFCSDGWHLARIFNRIKKRRVGIAGLVHSGREGKEPGNFGKERDTLASFGSII